jgi:hypothetical protein
MGQAAVEGGEVEDDSQLGEKAKRPEAFPEDM